MSRMYQAVMCGLFLMSGSVPAFCQNAIDENLGVWRLVPPAAYYTPGTIARGWQVRTFAERTGEKVLRIDGTICRAPADTVNFSDTLSGASFAQNSNTSFDVTGSWLELLNLGASKGSVKAVSLTFTGTIYEIDEQEMKRLRERCFGKDYLRTNKNKLTLQIQRLAVGKFEYALDFTDTASASLKANLTAKFAGSIGGNAAATRNGKVTLERGAMALPVFRQDWN